MNKLLVIFGLLLAVASGIFLYGESKEETGQLKERTITQKAQILFRKQFDKDRADGALRVSKAEANLHAERRKSDALKADIARRDKDAADWIAVRMPIPFSDLMWMTDVEPLTDNSERPHILNPRYDSR